MKKKNKNTKKNTPTKQYSSTTKAADVSSSSSLSSLPQSLLMKKNYKTKQQNKITNYVYEHDNTGLQTLVPSAVFVKRNFFTMEECKAWIEHSEKNIGFEEMKNPHTREYAHRECGRIQINDWNMAELLYERMKPLVDEIAKQVVVSSYDPSYQPVCCNGNIRIYKYDKNMSFGRHFDGSNSIDRFEGGNTEITVLIYLCSCEGGATRFYLPAPAATKPQKKKSKKQQRNTEDTRIRSSNNDGDGVAFVPEVGAILMHMHGDRCLEHEAEPVLRGVKYILRTDIVYGNVESKALLDKCKNG